MGDYAKAFDRIEWSYVDQCLDLFNFGKIIISWVKLLRTNSVPRIEQNGNFTDKIELSSGCQQGDPVLNCTRFLNFKFDFIDRILEMTLNPFWKDVLHSIKTLGKKE